MRIYTILNPVLNRLNNNYYPIMGIEDPRRESLSMQYDPASVSEKLQMQMNPTFEEALNKAGLSKEQLDPGFLSAVDDVDRKRICELLTEVRGFSPEVQNSTEVIERATKEIAYLLAK